ncbi:MAG TPA: tetratricopeptide repeat protein [Saprospiraceae bacterium]|nr:tetratricopeptide repeat protein [Saprospiraceae bacterium]
MPQPFTRWILISVFLFQGVLMYSQQTDLPLREWIENLSAKKDTQFELLGSVSAALFKLDSADRCRGFSELDERGPRDKRFMFRLKFIQAICYRQAFSCPGWPPFDSLGKNILRYAYEAEDPLLIELSNKFMLGNYLYTGDYANASMHGLIAKELQEEIGLEHFPGLAYNRYDLAYALFHSREYEASIDANLEAIYGMSQRPGFSKDTLDLNYRMNAWNTVGMCYDKLEKYDSAFLAYKQAKALSILLHNEFWTALIGGNEGNVYFKLGQYDSAKALLKLDYERSQAMNEFDNAANSLQLLAQIHAIQGDPLLALKEVRQADAWLPDNRFPTINMNVLYAYTRVFKALGNSDSLDYYMKKYIVLHDQVEKEATNARSEVVRLRIDNQEAVHKIVILNKKRQQITLIRNFSIALIIAITAFGFLYFNRQRLKMQLQQNEAMVAKAKAEAEAKEAVDQLNIFTQSIIDKTNLVEKLQEQLLQKELDEGQIQQISMLSQHTILTDADWDEFKVLFEKVYPGFFIKLKNQAPDITVAEQRMAALSKLKVPSKEAATLLGISPNSVIKTRSRLRQRLNLEPDADLEVYFA